MSIGFIIGKKVGMTRLFNDDGIDFPTTIVEAGPCTVTQIKTKKSDGYESVQIAFNEDNKKVNKSLKGHFQKSKVESARYLKENKNQDIDSIDLGDIVNAEHFEKGDIISVSGFSKGKGFAGHMKRHGFGGGRRSHGKNSVMRKPGSVGAGTDPSRIWPGTRMAGRMGNSKTTIKNLEVLRIDSEKNLIFIKGAVPGPKDGIVYIEKK
tara:strand:+ start:174 stop:797 length:624 start_codon:yes stop_codon:yes gene_type:complete